MRIATWNINSVRLRLPMVERFIHEYAPDVLCLQETKVINDLFPLKAFHKLGYKYTHILGMKSYNGVAILSRRPLENPGEETWVGREDCRHVSATLPGGVELHNFYVPAGGDIPDRTLNEKFGHKLDFVDDMRSWFSKNRKREDKIIVVGDLNIAPLEHDVWSHKQLLDVVSHTPVEVEKFTAAQSSLRFVDALRVLTPPQEKLYSWWSYRAQDWEKSDRGRRLDHIWLTAPLATSLKDGMILKEVRGWGPKPSDHVPVLIDLK